MAQYLISVHSYSPDFEYPAEVPPEMEELFGRVDALNQELQATGVWVFAGGLHPPSSATVVRSDGGGGHLVTDGPYAEAKEYLGGFWVIDVADLDEALNWARRMTDACGEAVEIRPFQDG